MATFEAKPSLDDSPPRRNSLNANGSSASRDTFSPVRMRPFQRAQTLGDITNTATSINRRRGSGLTTDSQAEKISMRSSVDDLLLPTSGTSKQHGSSHFHSTPLLFAVLPALGGILFEGGSVILTDVCIIGLACIFLNWSLRLPWDWYHSSQVYTSDAEIIDRDFKARHDTIIEEEDEDELDETNVDSTSSKETPKKSETPDDVEHKAATSELNRYQLIALTFCFAGPILGAWLLHSIREQLSRPSEGLISNFNLGIFILAAELRPTQHVFKLVQSRILYLQRTAAKNPYAPAEIDPVALDDIKARLGELEAHVVSQVEEVPIQDQQASVSTAVVELRKAIQPELDALNRAVRRYEKRSIALEMQVRAELQDHDQRIKDALALAAAVARQKKGSFMTVLDFVAAVLVLPVQAVVASATAIVEVPKVILVGTYEALEKRFDGKPAWLSPKRITTKRKEKDNGTRRKRRE